MSAERALEALALELEGADAALSSALRTAEEELARLRIGVPVYLTLADGQVLRYGKHRGRWGLGVLEPERPGPREFPAREGEQVRPLSALPRDDRSLVAAALPRLLEAAIVQLQERVEQRRRALATADAVVEGIRRWQAARAAR